MPDERTSPCKQQCSFDRVKLSITVVSASLRPTYLAFHRVLNTSVLMYVTLSDVCWGYNREAPHQYLCFSSSANLASLLEIEKVAQLLSRRAVRCCTSSTTIRRPPTGNKVSYLVVAVAARNEEVGAVADEAAAGQDHLPF